MQSFTALKTRFHSRLAILCANWTVISSCNDFSSYHRTVCRATLRVLLRYAVFCCILLFPCRNAVSALSFPYVYLHCKAFLWPKNLWLDSRYFIIKACTSTHPVFSMYLCCTAIPWPKDLWLDSRYISSYIDSFCFFCMYLCRKAIPMTKAASAAHPFISRMYLLPQSDFHDLRTCQAEFPSFPYFNIV